MFAGSAALVGLVMVGGAPGANAIDVLPESGDAFRLSYASSTEMLLNGNALSTGARLVGGDPNLSVAAGTVVGPPTVKVTANGDVTVGYTSQFLACPARNADLATCTVAASATQAYEAGRAPDQFRPVGFVPTANQVGSYLAWRLTIVAKNAAGAPVTKTVVSTRGFDPLVLPGTVATSRPPVIGVNGITAGQVAGLLVYPWTMPAAGAVDAAQSVVRRTVAAWICDSPDAGQVATPNWSMTGCTATPSVVGTGANASGNSATFFSIPTTESMGGKYLLSQVNVIASTTSGASFAYVIRSRPTQLPVAAAAPVDAGAGAAAALGAEVVATVEPDAVANSGLAAADAKTAAQAQKELISGDLKPTIAPVAAPVKPTVQIVAKNKAKRGSKYLVTVKLSGKGDGTVGTGPATVQLVKSNAPNAKAVARLKPITVEDMVGAKYEVPSRKLKPGTYYLRVIYTDAGSGIQSAALKKVRLY